MWPEITFKALISSCAVAFATLHTTLQRSMLLKQLLQELWRLLSIDLRMWTILVLCSANTSRSSTC